MKKFLKVIFQNILFLLILISFFELILGDWFKNHSWGDSLRSERLKKKNYSVEFNDKKYKFTYLKNSLGFRGNETSPEKLKIIMIGGSTTNQRFTPEENTIVGALNKLFQKEGEDIEIFNGGVDGQSTIGHINNFSKWFTSIENFNPEVIIYYIGINDRLYYNYDPNPENFDYGTFKTQHAFDNMMKSSSRDRILDYIKNNSFIMQKGKIIQNKYFNSKIKKADLSKFKVTYNLEHGYSENFYTQQDMDKKFDINDLRKNNKIYYDSFLKRLEYLTKLTKNIGAKPIFVNQVMNDGQLSEKLFFTNYIIRDFCLKNNIKFVDLAKNIVLDKFDFYDEFHTTPSGSKKIAEYIYPHLLKYFQNLQLIN